MLTNYSRSFPLDASEDDVGLTGDKGCPWNGPPRQGTIPRGGESRRVVIAISRRMHVLPFERVRGHPSPSGRFWDGKAREFRMIRWTEVFPIASLSAMVP